MASWKRLSAGALCFLLSLLLAASSHAASNGGVNVPALVDRYARKYGIPLHIARNLVRLESGGQQDAVSPSGARGVMQLMPETANALGIDIDDPEQNIEGGMRYLRLQYDRFGRWDLAVAAYHAGPAAVHRHNGVPPKSQAFVKAVVGPQTTAARAPSSTTARPASRLARGFAWPLQGPVMARFGPRHHGIDIAARQGTPIRASRAGKVASAGWYYDYGRTVILDHGTSILTLYGHASVALVRPGQSVKAGEVIARVGCTGRCTGPHVHFEIRINGRAVDPFKEIEVAGASAPRPPASPLSPAGQPDKSSGDETLTRRAVSVTGDTIRTVKETVKNGQVVRRIETVVVVLDDDLWIRITREFHLLDGMLILVEERTKIHRGDIDDEEEDEETHRRDGR